MYNYFHFKFQYKQDYSVVVVWTYLIPCGSVQTNDPTLSPLFLCLLVLVLYTGYFYIALS